MLSRSLSAAAVKVQRAKAMIAMDCSGGAPALSDSKVTGEVEAMMVKIACSEVPADASRWTMQLIADRLIELEVLESISSETVRTVFFKKRP